MSHGQNVGGDGVQWMGDNPETVMTSRAPAVPKMN